MKIHRYLALFATVALASLGLAASAGAAPTFSTDFENYMVGNVAGQFGWTGNDCGAVDEGVVNNISYPGAPVGVFANMSFRMSNATVSGCFRDAFTPPVDEAGEPTALNGGLSTGPRGSQFVAQYSFAPTRGVPQPGLNVQVSPDRGDGSRMSFVGMRTEANGSLTIRFIDVRGTDGTPPPCLQCANFVEQDLTGLNASVPHTIREEMRFVPGPSNDVVRVFVDGVLQFTGGSWEDYYTMDTESSPMPALQKSRTVDSLLIRASGPAAPSTANNGYLFDNISLSSSGTTPYIPTKIVADPILIKYSPPSLLGLRIPLPPVLNAKLTAGTTPLAGKTVVFTSPTFGVLCTGVTNTAGNAFCTTIPTLAPLLAALAGSYTASYAGDTTYLPSAGSAGLIG